MRATINIPDALFGKAKSVAAGRGIPLRELVCEALTEKLRTGSREDKPWMECFGKLRSLRAESVRVGALIETEFGQIEDRDWR